jgi:hypothetical protein
VTLGHENPTEYSVKAAPEPDRSSVYNFVKSDHRSPESRRRDYELRREATIDRIKEALRSNRPGAEVIAEFDQDASSEQIADLVREAKNRLERERAEAQEAKEDRRAEFQRRLQASRFICPYCNAIGGWDDYAEERHYERCSAYQEHKRQEEQRMIRQRNFVNRYD